MGLARITFLLFVLTVTGPAQLLLSVAHGSTSNGLLGTSMCPGPDWDGDGVPEVMAGAPEDPSHQPFPPVVLSPALPFPGNGRVEVLSGLTGAILTTLPGPFLAGRYGFAVHSPGDVDGDGVRDVAISAPARGGGNIGHVEVVSGATLQPLFPALVFPTISSTVPGASCPGSAADDWLFGHALATAGDVTGDGLPDFCASAPSGNMSNFFGPPRIVAFSGANGSVAAAACPVPWGFPWHTGWALADSADVNADGVADLIGTSLALGSVRTFSGVDGSSIGNVFVADSFYGFACARLPDQDGDGVADLAVSAPVSSMNGVMDGGRVVIHSGATLAVIGNLFGQTVGGHFGWSMDARGDFDGDGFKDLAVGVPGWASAAGNTGIVEVYSGATLQLLARLVSPTPTNAFAWSVAFVGDLTGDGRDELAVGAPTESNNGIALAGAVYIFGGLEPPSGAVGEVGLPTTGPESVLTLNGSAGGVSLRVSVGVGQPFSIDMGQPSTLATPAGFTLFAAVGLPSSATVYPTLFGNFSITPQPAAPANLLLFHVADSLGFGTPIVAATPAPWSVAVPAGFPQPLLLTFQGLIEDMPAPFPGNLAITNAVILDVQ